MKPLVVFYSRTGTTKKVASVISDNLNGTLEEIVDTVDRSGISGYAAAREDALLKRNTVIKEIHDDPALFDLIVIGTPVWLHTVSNPIRTYISQNKDKFKTVAFFCTQDVAGSESTFQEMSSLCEKLPISSLKLTANEVASGEFITSVGQFIDELLARITTMEHQE